MKPGPTIDQPPNESTSPLPGTKRRSPSMAIRKRGTPLFPVLPPTKTCDAPSDDTTCTIDLPDDARASSHRFVTILYLEGVPKLDIAYRLGLPEDTIEQILKSNEAQRLLRSRLKEIENDVTLTRLTDLGEKAVTVIDTILSTGNARDQIRAAELVFERRWGKAAASERKSKQDLSQMSDAELLEIIAKSSNDTKDDPTP